MEQGTGLGQLREILHDAMRRATQGCRRNAGVRTFLQIINDRKGYEVASHGALNQLMKVGEPGGTKEPNLLLLEAIAPFTWYEAAGRPYTTAELLAIAREESLPKYPFPAPLPGNIKTPPSPTQLTLKEQVEALSPSEKLLLLRQIADSLYRTQKDGIDVANIAGCGRMATNEIGIVGKIIRYEIAQRYSDFEEGWAVFKKQFDYFDEESLRVVEDIVVGRQQEVPIRLIGFVALALRRFSGKELYKLSYIESVQLNPHLWSPNGAPNGAPNGVT